MKVILAQKHAVKGRMFGPGEVDVDEATAETLKRRGALNHPLTAYPALIAAGIGSMDDALAMSDEALLKLPGVGPAMVKKLRGETTEAEPAKARFIGEKPDGAQK